jgi:hypothetical protein
MDFIFIHLIFRIYYSYNNFLIKIINPKYRMDEYKIHKIPIDLFLEFNSIENFLLINII